MNKIRNILVPVDFSRESKNALASAISLARETNAKLVVLHVFDKNGNAYRQAALEFFAALHGLSASSATAPTVDRWMQENSLDLYNFIHAVLREPGALDIKRRVEMGRPAGSILRAASEENADLIVLANKQRRFYSYFMGRSILLKLVLKSLCPVLLIGTYPKIPALPPIFRRPLARDDVGLLGSRAAYPAVR